MEYHINDDYELIAKHCPRCESLVMAQVVKTLNGSVYRYRDMRCSNCEWKSPVEG